MPDVGQLLKRRVKRVAELQDVVSRWQERNTGSNNRDANNDKRQGRFSDHLD